MLQPPSELPTISLNQLLARRQLLKHAGSGIGALGLLSLLKQEGVLESTHAAPSIQALNPLAPKPADLPAKAKSYLVIHQRWPQPR